MSRSQSRKELELELETMLQEVLPRDLTRIETMQARQDFIKRGRVLEEKLEGSELFATLSGSFADLLFLPDFSVNMIDDSAASATAPSGAPDALRSISDEDVIDVFSPDLYLKNYPGSCYAVEKVTHFPGYVHLVRLSITKPEGRNGAHEKGNVGNVAASTVRKPESKISTALNHHDHEISKSTVQDADTSTSKTLRDRTPKLMSAEIGQAKSLTDRDQVIEASNEEQGTEKLALQEQKEDAEGNNVKLLEQMDRNVLATNVLSYQNQGDDHDRFTGTRETIKSSHFHQVSRGHFECLDNPCEQCKAACFQGAAIQYPDFENFDIVSALRLHEWPEHTSSILGREHPSGWPGQQLAKQLGETRLLLVPKPHPLATGKEKEEMWRFSFSFVESKLANALPESARQAYLTVKFLVKVFREKASSHLKTYHLKTTLLWLVSSEPMASWKARSLAQNVELLLGSLRVAFTSRTIRNFFVPESNIIDYLSETESNAVAFCVEELRTSLAEKLTWLKGRVYFTDYRDEKLSDDSASTARVLFRESQKADDEETRLKLVNTAEQLYKDALKKDRFNSRAGLELGMLFQSVGNHLEAQMLFANAHDNSIQPDDVKAKHGYRPTYFKIICFNQDDLDILDDNFKSEVTHRHNHETVYHVAAVADYFLMLAEPPEAALRDAKIKIDRIKDKKIDLFDANIDCFMKHGARSCVSGNLLRRHSVFSSRASLLGYVFRAKGYHEDANNAFMHSYLLDWKNLAALANVEMDGKTNKMQQLVAMFSAGLGQ